MDQEAAIFILPDPIVDHDLHISARRKDICQTAGFLLAHD